MVFHWLYKQKHLCHYKTYGKPSICNLVSFSFFPFFRKPFSAELGNSSNGSSAEKDCGKRTTERMIIHKEYETKATTHWRVERTRVSGGWTGRE